MSDLTNVQKEIVTFLDSHGISSLGNIAKELRLSYHSALKNILFLKEEGVVENEEKPPLYNLSNK